MKRRRRRSGRVLGLSIRALAGSSPACVAYKEIMPTKLTWKEENPTLYQSLLCKDICGDAFRRLRETIKKIRDSKS